MQRVHRRRRAGETLVLDSYERILSFGNMEELIDRDAMEALRGFRNWPIDFDFIYFSSGTDTSQHMPR